MIHFSRKFFLAILLFISSGELSAQTYSLPGDGKDFFIGFVQPSYNTVANITALSYYGAYALVSSYTDNHITLSYFDKLTGVETTSQRYFIPERTGIQIPLDLTQMTPNFEGDTAEFCSCHITADRPINVEFFSTGACAGGSYLGLQTAALGQKYVIASYNDNPGLGALVAGPYRPSSAENSAGFFEIIAAFDSTNVTITPNATTVRNHQGVHGDIGATGDPVPYTVKLRRGQCYFVKSRSMDNAVDMSGSVVESDKPIAVLAGQENAFLGGPENPTKLDNRNYMIQQMLPVTYWDTTGYISIPFKDTQPSDTTQYQAGVNYRVYNYDTVASQVKCNDSASLTTISMPVAKFNYPAMELREVVRPVDFSTTNGIKFSVMMYGRRNFGSTAPFPAPCMMTIVPMSHWRTSFLWYVPANLFSALQNYYVNIIAPDSDFTGNSGILASFNGGPIKPIKNVLSIDQQFKKLPNYPNLTGIRFKVYTGSYYAKGPHPFMIYNYGYRGLDPDNDLGDFEGDDYFDEYALPVGILSGGGTANISITVDTFCSYWNVCVHDTTFGLPGHGIKSVQLLDDPHQDFVNTNPPKVYYNTELDYSLDPLNSREIDFSGDDSDRCFKVYVSRPIDSAYAPLFIVDDQGNAVIEDLHYQPPIVKLTPDSGRYLLANLQKDTCTQFVFYNIKGKSFTFTSAKLKHNNPNFKVTNISPSLPVLIKPGDSLVISACFNAKDTLLQIDTIELVNDCFTEPIDLAGSGSTPIILADDHDFGAVIVDSTKCAPIGIKNIGNAPLILTKQWLMNNYGVNFSFPDLVLLPITLMPKQKITLTFCYTPHAEKYDSTIMYWATNLLDPYKHSIKDSSILIGLGVRAGFVWDRTKQTFEGDSLVMNDSVIQRVYLYNDSRDLVNGPPVHIDKVYISGADSSEFYIQNTQLGKIPVTPFDLNPGDTIWVDVVFKPDLTKPYTQRFADRHANLVASGPPEVDQIVKLIGTWAVDGVTISSPSQQLFTIRPNPASGNSVIVTFQSPIEKNATLSLYDVLGRELRRKTISQDLESSELSIGDLQSGVYYIRFSSESGTITKSLHIER